MKNKDANKTVAINRQELRVTPGRKRQIHNAVAEIYKKFGKTLSKLAHE